MNIVLRILVVIILSNFAFGGILPVGRPDTETSYDYLRELYLRGYADPQVVLFSFADYRYIAGLSSNDMPPMFNRLSDELICLSRRFYNEPKRLKFDLSVVPYGSFNDNANKSYIALCPQINYQLSDKLFIDIAYRIDSGLTDDTLYAGKRWNEFAGYAEHALVSYRGKRLIIDVGRRRAAWGIARKGKTLMHSATAMPFDGLFINYKISKALSFHSTIAWLTAVEADSLFLETGQTENRYFSAHALRISPARWLDIVLKESVVYGGLGRRPEPYYVMPLLWFHAEQLNANSDDNTFLGLETVVRLRNRYAGYLELLVDDFQIEKKNASDREPNEIGLIAGFDIFDFPLKMGFLELEYSRIANRTYNQMKSRNRYVQQNYPIGFPLGPDNESLNLSYTYHIKKNLTLDLSFFVLRRGEGRMNDDWQTPWLDDPSYSEKFPSGIVEKMAGSQICLVFHKDDYFQGKLSYGLAEIKNKGNISGVDETDWNIEFEIIFNPPSFGLTLADD